METPVERAKKISAISRLVKAGSSLTAACAAVHKNSAWYATWSERMERLGLDGLEDLPRSGRPPSVRLSKEEADYLRRTYLRSNLRDGSGSLTAAARFAAKDATSPLSQETRQAILKIRASKHLLPVEVRRALRASEAEVRRHRDPKSGQNDGLYTPGWLRMSSDGTRRLVPGERQVWDDASVNVGVVVPWARGGDKCSDRFGVRVARFQLLACVDCAGDFCPGYSYVMRENDAYSAADVTAALWRVWQLNGYAPDECVMEGGSWQAGRTLDFLAASGVQLISAKGRPNQKLVEGWFNRLWTVLSMTLPPRGQVGRFRGEMASENTQWRRCREGAADPREHFPLLSDFLNSLDKSINFLNSETVESRLYGTWTPCEQYAAQAAKGHPLPQGLRRYALPVRENRKLLRFGEVNVTAPDAFGYPTPFKFVSDDAAMFQGADVTVSFDPCEPEAGAVIELASDFHDMKAGRVIDPAARCVSAVGEMVRTQSGIWAFRMTDPRDEAREAKRASRAKVGAQVAAFDERGVKARHAEHEGKEQYAFGEKAAESAEITGGTPVPQEETDWAKLEAAAGIMVS